MAPLYTWALCLIFILLATVDLVAAKVPAVIVFGDSTVDSGNNNWISTLLKSNFAPYGRDFFGGRATGRFSNGRIPPDFISEAYGLRPFVPAYLDPMFNISDFVTGVCFASAGTGYDEATSQVLSVIPLSKEIEYYKEYQNKLRAYVGNENANRIISEALYLVSMGTNDFLENYYLLPNRQSQYNVDQYENFLVGIAEGFIRTIYELGARKISYTGLPPMGCLPLERTTNAIIGGRGPGCIESYNNVALSFNGKLGGLLDRLNGELPGIKIIFANPYFILKDMIEKPSIYGFESVSVACCSTGLVEMSYMCDQYNPFTCSDASKFVFWDAFHPTDKTNRIVSQHLVNDVLKKVFF